MYKISQEHLELIFGQVRASGGFNNNPTSHQFKSAYKKLVFQSNNIDSFNAGNCIPLESIDILHFSSTDPVKTINSSSEQNIDLITSEEFTQEVDAFSMHNDHDYLFSQNMYNLSNFTREVIIYVAGFVVHKLLSTLS